MSKLEEPSEIGRSTDEGFSSVLEYKEKVKALREKVPRSSHRMLSVPGTRPDPISLLQDQEKTRLKNLLPIKYGRMLVSPFTFFRGAAAIMAYNLAATPVTGLQAQLCGDAHLLNFGIFATPERKLVFDINDFDETHPGPWEWDLKRLATSAVLAGRENGFENEVNKRLARTVSLLYRKAMADFAQAAFLDVWYYHVEIEELLKILAKPSRRSQIEVQAVSKRARKNTQAQTIEKLTEVIQGRRWIRNDPPLLTRLTKLMTKEEQTWITKEKRAEKLYNDYINSLPEERRHLLSHFTITDGAFKVGGIGSIGTRCLIFLLEGNTKAEALLLQLKESEQSVLAPYVEKKAYINQAQRVVLGQKLIQGASDIFLGWHDSPITKTSYYWRQLKDMKGSFDIASLDATGMEIYLKVCSICLARAHARTGNAAAISSYIGNNKVFINAVTDFAIAYADQTERDYTTFKEAVKAGKIKVKTEI